jgi:hypothetical protein
VIVIRQTLMCVAVEHRLDGVMVVMGLAVVAMLMESEGEDRHATHHPQQRADHNNGSEISSHD